MWSLMSNLPAFRGLKHITAGYLAINFVEDTKEDRLVLLRNYEHDIGRGYDILLDPDRYKVKQEELKKLATILEKWSM